MINSVNNSLLDVRDLSTWFPVRRGLLAGVVGYVKALNHVNLTVRHGEVLGLIGESGSGKTTLGRTLMGLEKATTGSAQFSGRTIVDAARPDLSAWCRDLQMIFQDPYASLNPRMTVLDIITEGMAYHGLLQESRTDAAVRLLNDVGMDASALHRYPFEFSGGQRQRISIARALSMQPSLVICDEAVSALDVSVQAQVLNLLMDLKAKYNLSYLFISHDLSVVRHVADRIAVMYLGHIVEEGPAGELMDNPKHPYTQALLSAIPMPGVEKKARIVLSGEVPSAMRPPAGCPFHTRCPKVMEACRRAFPAEILTEAHKVSCHLYTLKL